MDTLERIKQQIADNAVILYMKGSPEMPQCGFSARAAQALMACGVEFAYINILENPDIRETLPQYAQWPTFPQLYIGGELIGGSDIIQDLYTKGELQTMLEKVSSV
ncbi:MAG: Grx4 family monothiol glutaredoxin [Gammaproteobacteria bacterium]